MTEIDTKRWRRLAGLETEETPKKETLKEGFANLGMAQPGILGNPFETALKEMDMDGVTLEPEKVNVEDDHEGAMARSQLDQMAGQAETLLELMPEDAELEAWVQSKLTLAAEMLDVVTHYLLDEHPEEEEYDAHVDAYKEHEDDLDEGKKKGLWDNIHAKRARGEKAAKPGDEDYPDKDTWEELTEAEYQGRDVPLNKPMQGDVKKFKVYVKDPKTGNVKKVNFGDPNMRIRKSNPEARKSFRARHNCDNPGPKTKARYWSCKKW